MDSEVSSTNPYSRLMALKRMGVVKNYESIRSKSVIIIGMGGIGSVVGEMLCRCGIGKLHIFDYDKVELANMNRMFYLPEHVGKSKVEAAKISLGNINGDVEVITHDYNITQPDKYELLMDTIITGGKDNTNIDLLLSCVDNYSARITINRGCNSIPMTWMESGVSENAMSGHIQLIIPGQTACFECASPLVMEMGEDEGAIKREGVCAASLPTTMGVIAGLLAQNALKYLLHFGVVTQLLNYNALKDFFPNEPLLPNPQCKDPKCLQRQGQLALNPGLRVDLDQGLHLQEEGKDLENVENEWGIEIVQEGGDHTDGAKGAHEVEVHPTTDLDTLAAEMENLQGS